MKKVIFIGMDLFPPYNEFCSKLAEILITGLSLGRGYQVISFGNPGVKMSSAPNENYIAVPNYHVLMNAILLPIWIVRYSYGEKAIVHFLMPAKHTKYVKALIFLCRLMGHTTVFTLLKSSDDQIVCSSNSDRIVTQSQWSTTRARTLLERKDRIREIVPGSVEFENHLIERRPRTVLFVGVPWKRSDFEKRGVYFFFELVKETFEVDKSIEFILVNRSITNRDYIEELAGNTKGNLTIEHKSVEKMGDLFSSVSIFLCLHQNMECPDPPLSVIEAISCGCPIISTKFNSVADDIETSNCGDIVAVDASSFAESITRISDNSGPYLDNARRLGSSSYQIARFKEKYNTLYSELD
ncbi:glycosyltransferase family 1 protein [Halieaceae bacterium IMCC14734]|uniref:Glycosyltransferase family 1 protein n=1 Tax=Candidatus Litorirhabdus singularis TaxID=2518993 RepID=A0ABT3THT3_9GAMM|nr:glycosyltransferase [Candidatus Litorirhabdus singularis]MCX2981301.1 glycosyltransferase family 1 protein [Candidatus Litorirhabdus singularis]